MTEQSVSSSRPFECYKFDIDGIDGQLRYTSDKVRVTAQSVTYEPLEGLKRSDIAIQTNGEVSDLAITCPVMSELGRKCGIFDTPRRISLELLRYERADVTTPVMRYTGQADGASIQNEMMTIKFPDSFASGLAGKIPHHIIQGPCNYMLGDRNCKKDLTGMGVTVTSVTPVLVHTQVQDGEYVVVGAFDGTPYAAELWQGGVCTLTVGSVTESRTIWEAIKLVSPATAPKVRIKLGKSFTLPFGSHVMRIMPGCDNSLARCHAFGNQARFMGFPDVPTERANPFVAISKGQKA